MIGLKFGRGYEIYVVFEVSNSSLKTFERHA